MAMKILIVCFFSLLSLTTMTDSIFFDFGNEKAGRQWRVINDDVMGGLSQGKVMLTDQSLRFQGEVSLANNGGFSSCRSSWGQYDISAYETVEVRVRGRGCAFGLVLETSQRWFDPYYKQIFTPTNEWQIIQLPLSDCKVYKIGRAGKASLEAAAKARIVRFGFITDKQAGPFELEVDYIKFLE